MTGPSIQTPMMQQYHDFKRRHPDKFIFFRLGDFYELFYDDAVQASKLLQISLTKRHEVPMCGIPHHQLENYAPKLIQHGAKIAVVDQVGEANKSKTIVEREVVRIMTPATITEGRNLVENENNYLACILIPRHEKVGRSFVGELVFALLDVSTGESSLHTLSSRDVRLDLDALLSRYNPKELLVSDEWNLHAFRSNFLFKNVSPIINAIPRGILIPEHAHRQIKHLMQLRSLSGLGLGEQPVFASAFYGLMYYVSETKITDLKHLRAPKIFRKTDFMVLDRASQRNLELLQNAHDQSEKHSLLWVLDKTVSSGGGRAIKKTILHPLLSLKEIQYRLGLVTFFVRNKQLLNATHEQIKQFSDVERLSSKLGTGRILPKEILALKNGASIALEVVRSLQKAAFPYSFSGARGVLESVRREIQKTLLDEPKATLKEGHVVRPESNAELQQWRRLCNQGSQALLGYQNQQRSATNIASLKIKYNENSGYYIEVPKSQSRNIPGHYIKKQTLSNVERFTTPELLQKQEDLLSAESRAIQLEKNLYNTLVNSLIAHIGVFQQVAEYISQLDVLCSFAKVAIEHGYVRPQPHEGHSIEIVNGRHPVVEKAENFNFVPNSLSIGTDKNLVQIITGPNMAGKSTFLRQNALITLMAQIGSYVPAAKAHVAICDRIFTRVGASDNLAKGESTFLVEMNETAYILNNATPRSFLVLDEIGRGTSTYDGIAIASAVVEHIVNDKSCGAKTLFATHYSELTSMNQHANVTNYTMSVKEQGNELIFHKKVTPGVADKSYGVHVAQLSGMPKGVIRRARQILKNFESEEGPLTLFATAKASKNDSKASEPNPKVPLEVLQVLDVIKKLNLETLTPLDGLLTLEKLQAQVRHFFS